MIGTSLQHGTVELATGLAVAAKIVRGEDVDANPVYVMPPVTADNVADVLKNVVTDRAAFLKRLPALVDQNLVDGDIANEE